MTKFGRRWFCHDPEVYPEPSTFNPDRFLVSIPPPDPTTYVFGFGRRICPGRLLAESSVWLTIAKSLAAFDIKPGIDDEPKAEFLPGFLSHPAPFKATIIARSAGYEKLIQAVECEHPWKESSAKVLETVGI